MLHQERRNDLFPFANYAGHDFALQRQGLDGDVAYNINAQGQATRGGDARDRRMWMYANPVVAVRAALDPANTIGNRRTENGSTLIDITLKSGDVLTIGLRSPSNLLEFVRWIAPQINLGEVVTTTRFFGYENFAGVELPMGYSTRFDWRPEVEQVKVYVDSYVVDGSIADLAAPLAGAQGDGGRGRGGAAGGPIEVTPMARGIWRITGGTMVIEFADHMTLFEVDGQPARIKQVIEAARKLVPSKPVTQVIVSHHHFDHSSGLREAVAEGLMVISRRDNAVIFKEMTDRHATHFPDDLEKSGRTMTFIPVDDPLTLKDATQTVELYHVIANSHMADGLFAYVPEHQNDDRRRYRHRRRRTAVVGRQLARQHRAQKARRSAQRPCSHDADDARRSDCDGERRYRAREGVLRPTCREGRLFSRMSGAGAVNPLRVN
jgi:hypothetical protein